MGGAVDQGALELFRLGMAEFERRQLLQVVVQQPGMVERGLQDQRLAARHRAAMAAMHRAGRQLLADHDIRTRPPPPLGIWGRPTPPPPPPPPTFSPPSS